jgi:hypothetical protein
MRSRSLFSPFSTDPAFALTSTVVQDARLGKNDTKGAARALGTRKNSDWMAQSPGATTLASVVSSSRGVVLVELVVVDVEIFIAVDVVEVGAVNVVVLIPSPVQRSGTLLQSTLNAATRVRLMASTLACPWPPTTRMSITIRSPASERPGLKKTSMGTKAPCMGSKRSPGP